MYAPYTHNYVDVHKIIDSYTLATNDYKLGLKRIF